MAIGGFNGSDPDAQGWWVHLRRCAGCGNIGCCDSSPGQHATAHAHGAGHRYVQSSEPGEDRFFDYRSGEVLEGPRWQSPPRTPASNRHRVPTVGSRAN